MVMSILQFKKKGTTSEVNSSAKKIDALGKLGGKYFESRAK